MGLSRNVEIRNRHRLAMDLVDMGDVAKLEGNQNSYLIAYARAYAEELTAMALIDGSPSELTMEVLSESAQSILDALQVEIDARQHGRPLIDVLAGEEST